MIARQAVPESILAQVVADGDLAAISVAAAVEAELIDVVWVCLHEDRNVDVSYTNRISDPLLIPEVG
jgi:hypothetical protein